MFYSSRPGITVKLLLGAAGRPVSPIWSKNLPEDQLYVCLKPHDGDDWATHGRWGNLIPSGPEPPCSASVEGHSSVSGQTQLTLGN